MSANSQIFDFPDLEFFAELDKITSPKPSLDANELLRRERQKTEKLRSTLQSFRTSTSSLLELYKKEQTRNTELESALKESKDELSIQKQSFIELENSSLNKLLFQEQTIAEFRSKKQKSSEDHVELAKEYLELLSEITTNNNYKIDGTRITMVRKVESFMKEEDSTFKAKIIEKRKSVQVSELDTLGTIDSTFKKKKYNPKADDGQNQFSVPSVMSIEYTPSKKYSVEMMKPVRASYEDTGISW